MPSSRSPLLAVIIPVYKVEPYLRQCLDSVCGQTYTNLKIILVDDGSPDASGAICDEYAAKDPRITVIHQENGGPSKARNAGLRLVGDCRYVAFMDSDDLLELDIYAQCVSLLEADPQIDLVQFAYRTFGPGIDQVFATEDVVITSPDICRNYANGSLTKNPISASLCNKVYRASLCQGLSFREGYQWEDVPYNMEVLYRAQKVQLLSRTGLHYRKEREGAITQGSGFSSLPMLYDNLEDLLDRYQEDPLFRQYASVLLVTHLWSGCKDLARFPEAYQEYGASYFAFVKQARKHPLPKLFSKSSTYYKRLLFLYMPKLYVDIYTWLSNRRKAKS